MIKIKGFSSFASFMKLACIVILLHSLVGCTDDRDYYNEMQAKVDRLNNLILEKSSDVDYQSTDFNERHVFQLSNWNRSLEKKSDYQIFLIDSKVMVLSYIDGYYAFSPIDNLALSINDYSYDILLYDDVSQSFRLFSKSMGAKSLTIISRSDS